MRGHYSDMLTSRRDYHLLKNWAPEDWRRQNTALTEDSTSRRLGRPVNIPPVETTTLRFGPKTLVLFQTISLNVFLKYYGDYQTGLRIFSDWIKLS